MRPPLPIEGINIGVLAFVLSNIPLLGIASFHYEARVDRHLQMSWSLFSPLKRLR